MASSKKAGAKKAPAVKEDDGKKSVIGRDHGYNVYPIKTASGRRSVDSGDALAAALRGKSLEDVVGLVELNGMTKNPAWANINAGLARMAAGNMLRAELKRKGKLKGLKGVTYETEKKDAA